MADYDGSTGHDTYTGTPDPDTISGNGGDDALSGAEGDDVIGGGDDDDVLHGGDGNDTLTGGAGTDAVYGEAGSDVLVLGQGELDPDGEIFDGGDDTDWLRYTGTSDVDLSSSTLTGVEALESTGGAVIALTRIQFQNLGFVNAAVRITDYGDVRLNHMTLANGTIYLSDFGNTFDMTPGTLLAPVTVHGGASNDTVIGIGNADTVYGAGGDDLLFGGAGDDLLEGGAGRDAVFGEAGNDVLVLGEGELSGGETFNGGADTDTLRYTGTSDIDLSGTTITGIERLEATNGAVIGLTRAQLSGFAYIDAAVRITDGGYVTLAGQTLANGTIYLSDLGNYIDLGTANALVPLTVHGGALYDTLLGHNVLVDTLYGGDGDDLIDGGGGDDLMYGGAGDDQYYVTGTGDQVFENAGEGVDLVATSLSSYTLGANLENLTLFGVTNSSGTGNSADNVIRGSLGRNTLTGGTGRDEFYGDFGNDTLVVAQDDAATGEVYDGGDGTDLLRYDGTSMADFSSSTILSIETLTSTNGGVIGLTVAQLESLLTINGPVWLTDGGAVNLSALTLGNKFFYLSDTGTTIDFGTLVNAASRAMSVVGGGGSDTITGTGNADTLLGGDGDDTLDGGGGDDELQGGDGNDILTGGTGSDIMIGGLGDDAYYVDSNSDRVIEWDGEGADTVYVTLGYYELGTGLDDLRFIGAGPFVAFGNGLDNSISGGDSGDTLHGGDGNDTLAGGLGADLLSGAGGRDTLYGGDGDDIFQVTDGDIQALDYMDGGSGADQISYIGSSDLDLSVATIVDVETLSSDHGGTVSLTVAQLAAFTHVHGAVRLTDGGTLSVAGLTFESGSSLTLSDAGNIVDFTGSPTTAITVHGGDGIDSVTGTAASDTLHGGGGGDWLDGGGGGDVMAGGAGNDNYSVDNAGDQVYESDGEGSDSVYTSTASYTLSDNVEGLITVGTGYFTGIGNGQNNNIVGGEFGNNIDGRGGNDIIYGGAGADTLRGADGTDAVYGRAGNDVFQIAEGDVAMGDRFDGGADNDQITYLGVIDFDLSIATIAGVESLHVDWGTTVSLTIAQLQGFSTVDAVVRLTDGGVVDLAGTALAKGILYLSEYGNTIDLSSAASIPSGMSVYGGGAQDVITGTATDDDQLFGGGGNDVLDGLAGDDVMTGGTGDDTYHVDSAGDEVVENADEGHDTVQTTLASYTLAANVEDLTYAGSSAFTGTGNSLDNAITGGDGSDTLIGGGGADDLRGGWGNDTFVVGEGDLVDGARFDGAEGNDTLRYTGSSAIDLSGATLTGIEKLEADNDVTLGLTVAQLASLGYVGPGVAVRLTDAGTLTLSSMLLVHDLYLADAATVPGGTIGSSIDVSNTLVAFPLTIHGSNFDDTIIGTNGQDDTLYGGGGRDSLSGGAGNDTLVVAEGDYVAGEIYDGGSMTDTLRYAGNSDLDLSGATITGIERLVSDYAVTISLTVAQLESLTYVGPTVTVRLVDGGPVDLGGLTFEGSALYLSDDGNAVDLRDLVNASTAWFTVHGGAGQDQITGGANNDTLNGGDESDVLDGSGGDDAMTGGTGDDTYTVDSVGDQVNETADEGTDRVVTTLVTYTLGANVENLTYGGSGNFSGWGNALANAITGGTGNDTLTGGLGKDSVSGGDGNDTLVVGQGDAVAGETYDGGAGIDELRYTGVFDVDFSGSTLVGIERLVSAVSATAQIGLTIAQLESLSYVGGYVRITEGGAVSLDGITMQFNMIRLSDLGNTIDARNTGPFGLTIVGGAAGDTMLGSNSHTDSLFGYDGNDWLDGGNGSDEMTGGVGDDTYVVDDGSDQVVEGIGGGTDLVRTTLASYTLGFEVENLIYTGSGSFTGTGNALANAITGGAGNDTLIGGAGTDSVSGGDGNDVLVVGEGDLTGGETFDGGAGVDELRYTGSSNIDLSSSTIAGIETLANTGNYTALIGLTIAQLESLATVNARVRLTDGGAVSLDGILLFSGFIQLSDLGNSIDLDGAITPASITVQGGALADTIFGSDTTQDLLYGGGGDDVLDGRGDSDDMYGGAGDDTYYVDDRGDGVTENVDEGHDRVVTTLASYLLAPTVEDLAYAGTGDFTGIGNTLDNAITGGAGNDTLTGGWGKDSLSGGDGDDTLVVGEGDYVTGETFDGGSGTDELRFTGDNGVDLSGATLVGIERLVVTGGPWVMIGLTIAQLESLSYVGGYVRLTEGGAVSLDGITMQFDSIKLSELGNTIDARNAQGVPLTISGGAGNDTMLGSTTNSDWLLGGGGDDWLDGGFGVDFLTGGTGDDTYVVDNSGDQVNEDLDAGIDTVRATAASFTLSTNVENLIYVGSANFTGTGNGLANRIDGGAGSDLLKGMAGDDVLTGGGDDDELQGGDGDDWYYVDQVGDVVVEAAGGGSDRVLASASYTLVAGAEIELLTTTRTVGTVAIDLTGNEFDNRIHGNAGANVLSGGAGNDALSGNAGNDVLIGGDGRDRLEGGDGFDTASYATAGAGVTVRLDRVGAQNTGGAGADKLVSIEGVSGSDFADTLIGNAQDNVLSGGDGDDSLNGAGGNDTLIGGAGDDYYLVDGAGVTVVETADAGTDTVRAGIDYTLTDNVENLVLAGAARAGTGNALDNTLTGAGASNTLRGLAGNDALFGGGGRDTLEGGDGGDLLDGGAGKDTLTGGSGRDVFAFDDGDFAATRALADVITDFSQADGETIRLNTVDADVTAAGDHGFAWIGNGAFTGVAGQLHYALQGGTTYVEGDTNGDGLADFAIALTGTINLVAGDFVL